ncbi:MAG: ornithine cyclodeaminase family protein [Fimbriimonadales bacterium]|nr:ornithine cyclodeaminase family protein [Fimbriimonadales bacterium]MDW8052715.1 ornithine cyclodeaminase family protein [Armatimonadota bacterium]
MERIQLGTSAPLLIREAQVREVLTVSRAIEALEAAFCDWAHGRATNQPRQRVHAPQGILHLMGAAWYSKGYIGYKAYLSFPTGTRFHVVLASAHTGELLALIEADWLGRIRTGAASGLATKYLAREDASTVAILGTGGQAGTQLEAICAVRPISRAFVYSRTPEKRIAFAQQMHERLGIPVQAADSVEQAIAEADIVCTITTAREPILQGALLRAGMHINAAGANSLARRELDTFAVGRCERIVVDDVQQARLEAAELVIPIELCKLSWERVEPLAHIVGGLLPPRQAPEHITLFKSLGIALEDVAAAAVVYEMLAGNSE